MPGVRSGGEIQLNIPDLRPVLPHAQSAVTDMIAATGSDSPARFQIGTRTSGLLEVTRVRDLRAAAKQVAAQVATGKIQEGGAFASEGRHVGYSVADQGLRTLVKLGISEGPLQTLYTVAAVDELDDPSYEWVFQGRDGDNPGSRHEVSVSRWRTRSRDDEEHRLDTLLIRERVPRQFDTEGELVPGREVRIPFRLDSNDGEYAEMPASNIKSVVERIVIADSGIPSKTLAIEPEYPFK